MSAVTDPNPAPQRLVLVTGPSGAGRTTANRALEDLGFEVIDNLPLSLLPRLLSGPPLEMPLAIGADVRNRDFSADAFSETIAELTADEGVSVQVLYLDCSEDVLLRRYSETRRRHPLAPEDHPIDGIRSEVDLLRPIRARADILIDTSDITPHDLRAELATLFGSRESRNMGITVQSFSYKRGLPRGLDFVVDCRFLRNPHWEETLRPLDGRDSRVSDHVRSDPQFAGFWSRLEDLLVFLVPAYRAEGKTHLTIGFGCTGGRHRSVAVTEMLAQSLADREWQVSKRHRELDRQAGIGGQTGRGQDK